MSNVAEKLYIIFVGSKLNTFFIELSNCDEASQILNMIIWPSFEKNKKKHGITFACELALLLSNKLHALSIVRH